MAQLVMTLIFAALGVFAARAILQELHRPLHQPWLKSGFAEQATRSAARSTDAAIDLRSYRNRVRVAAMARQVRPQASFAAAA